MNSQLLSFFGKTLQLAIVADQEYEQAKTNGTATLLQPNNFQNAIAAVAEIFAATPTTTT